MQVNKKIGNYFENRLTLLLQKNGYWCHLFAYNKNGQPCDVIAVNKDKTILIDVKHCDSDRFATSRIEPNQKTCFKYARSCGVKYVGFAIWFESEQCFKWLPYSVETNNLSSIHKDNLIKFEDFLCL